jgi:CRP/FNR family cyclic AMP-dependent transcriptional regulator
MASSTTSPRLQTQVEDVLAQLPISHTTEYAKGQIIYSPDDLSSSIYLVVSGKVGISQIAEEGREVLLEIVQPDELFGESAFLDSFRRSEQATAIEKTTLMSWSSANMEGLVMKRPRLALALLQILAQRNVELIRRIESLSSENAEQRLARSLIHFSERLGTLEEDGSMGMMPFTHEMLSHYVGTTREVVTQYMVRFRKEGYLRYSRRSIQIYRDPLRTWLSASVVRSPSPDGTLC